MSRFTEILLVSPLADCKSWVIKKEFGYDVGKEGSGVTVDVPIGFMTDFASIPRPLWVLLPKWGKYGNAAVIHDYCYWEQIRSRKESDSIFREAMEVLKVAKWKIFCMYWAVRLCGGFAWSGNSKKRKDVKNKVTLVLPENSVETASSLRLQTQELIE